MSDDEASKSDFHISVYPFSLFCRIDLPFEVGSHEDARLLEDKVHTQLKETLRDFQENFLTKKIQ